MSFFEKILSLLNGRPAIGGLEIGDTALRYSVAAGGTWKLESLRLPPGIIAAGEIKRFEEFVEALRTLRRAIGKAGAKLPVVMALSSVKVYTQPFNLPLLKNEEELDKAVELNLRMSSPLPFDQAYAGTELLRRDEDGGRMEYLAAYVNRTLVDQLSEAAASAGFLPVAVEPRGLSLARVVKRAANLDYSKAYIVMSLDTNGLQFLIFRNGGLYFDYFNTWSDFEAQDREIPLEGFRTLIVRGLTQVINFYRSQTQWQEPIEAVLVASAHMSEEVQKIITENFGLTVGQLNLDIPGTEGGEAAVVLGAAMRGNVPRAADHELSLAAIDVREELRRDQTLAFLSFWRTIMPVGLVLILAGLIGTELVLRNYSATDTAAIRLSPDQAAAAKALTDQAAAFNQKVALLAAAEAGINPKSPLLDKLLPLLSASHIHLSHLSLDAARGANLSGDAGTQDDIINLRKAMEADPAFANVVLPFTAIKTGPQGYSFGMSFSFSSAKR